MPTPCITFCPHDVQHWGFLISKSTSLSIFHPLRPIASVLRRLEHHVQCFRYWNDFFYPKCPAASIAHHLFLLMFATLFVHVLWLQASDYFYPINTQYFAPGWVFWFSEAQNLAQHKYNFNAEELIFCLLFSPFIILPFSRQELMFCHSSVPPQCIWPILRIALVH